MTRLLISVRSPEEAQTAMAGGADIIDVKEPSRGSLGMADSATIQKVVKVVAGQLPVSAALGELIELQSFANLSNVKWVKVGLSCLAHQSFQEQWRQLALRLGPATLLGVFYADHQRVTAPDFETVFNLVKSSPHSVSRSGILIDTAIKDGQGLFHWTRLRQLQEYRQMCHDAKLFLALAGSLQKNDLIPIVEEVQPEIIAMRGAACEKNQRHGKIYEAAVRELKDEIAR